MAPDEQYRRALQALASALRDIPSPSMIIGGLAVIAAGVPRQTIDIDVTVLGRGTDLETLLAAFVRHAIVPRIDDALEFARRRQILLSRSRPL